MKKLVYLLAIVPMLFLSSCLESPEVNKAVPGVTMHNYIMQQNTVTLEPISAAYMLNILLNEALDAGVEIDDEAAINALKVKVGEGQTQWLLMELLLPYCSKVEVAEEGVYDILMDLSGNGITYDGKIRVDTQKELLDDLSADKNWTISLLPNVRAKYTRIEGTETLSVSSDVEYGIFPTEQPYGWDIKIEGLNVVSSIIPGSTGSDWSGEYTLNRSKGSERLTVEGSHASTFEFEGGAEGITMYELDMKYSITSPLTYGSCENVYRNYLLKSGKIGIEFTGDHDKGVFPVSTSKSEWSEGTGCHTTVTIYYNDSSYSVSF